MVEQKCELSLDTGHGGRYYMGGWLNAFGRSMSAFTKYILFALAVIPTAFFVERTWQWLRSTYLKSRQPKVLIDYGKEVTLRLTLWGYSIEIIWFIVIPWLLTHVHYRHGGIVDMLIDLVVTLALILPPVGVLVIHLRTRVVIGVGKQMRYFVGKYCRTLQFDGITKYSCDGYSYYITRKDGYILKIPAFFKHSEIIMAFLENAVSQDKWNSLKVEKKRGGPKHKSDLPLATNKMPKKLRR